MRRCKAVAYLIEVRKLNARSSDNLKFGKFDGSQALRIALQKILQKYPKYVALKLHDKIFKVDLDKANAGPLTGLIMSGDYGQAGDIIDSASGNVSYKKKKTESLAEPFYFYIAVPDNETRGIVVLQQTGLQGVKGLFETAVVGVFESQYPDYRLHVRQLTIADTLAQYLKGGNVEELIVEKHEIPADIADLYGGQKKVYPGTFTQIIKSSAGLFKKSGLIAFAKGQKKLEDVFEFDDHGFDVVKAKIRIGDELKSVNLTKPDSISMSVDITDDVKFGADGHPTRASLKSEFDKVAADLAKRGGIKL
ncbi:hypothetical protein [Shinella fusca]|uniref:Uncharacterized protein n=1 Tax=Shinella fusca TaxID=544480 RepID=A0A7W8DTZ8_9HYPH|nr:hypothetical protein [Shinella fusca]MBB5041945.1 hypothetical protein [Shinella fusca]